jgi:LPS O-antigen subunit length determinant protein (WzzB/FepE family)
MAQNLTQPSPYDDEIDLREIFKILIESKKLIILTTLVFTIASIIYSLSIKPEFKSSSILEIGYYEMPDATQELIERPTSLISHLKIQMIKNLNGIYNQNASMKPLNEKLIYLETTSNSAEQNENLLTEMINYIEERHSNLVLLKKDRISHEIDLIESELSSRKESMKFDLIARIAKLQSDLPILDEEAKQLNQVIIQDSNNLNILRDATLSIERASNSPTLEQIISSYKSHLTQLKKEKNIIVSDLSILSYKLDNINNDTFQSNELLKLKQSLRSAEDELQDLITQAQVQTQPIGNIETKTIKPKTLLIISLGLIFGFITGILMVFIRNFMKSFRESEA